LMGRTGKVTETLGLFMRADLRSNGKLNSVVNER